MLHRASCCLASLACRWRVRITQLIVAVIHCARRCHAHPNIVQLKEVFLTVHHLAVVMEYMKGSNMPTYLAKHAPLPEPVARCTPFESSSPLILLRHVREERQQHALLAGCAHSTA